MDESNRYSGAHLLVAFLAGAAAGAIAAYLTAPQSGHETRETLRGWARDAREKAVRVPHAVRSAYDKASVAAKEAFVQALKSEAPEEKTS